MGIRPRETVVLAGDFAGLVAWYRDVLGFKVVQQFQDDFHFANLEAAGGAITFGPSFDKKDEFWFGGFADPEGNPCWVVDKNCP